MVVKPTVLKNGQVLTTTYNKLTGKTTQTITGKPIPGLLSGSNKPFAYGVHGLATITYDKNGQPHLNVLRQPDSPVDSTLTTIGGIPTLITKNTRTGKLTIVKHPELAQPKIEFHSLGRGAWIQTSTDPVTNKITITDRATGQPYPVDKFKNPDGTYTLVGNNPVTGKPFTIQAGIAKVVPPTIRANKVDGGYDVFDTNTGVLQKHIPGNVAKSKPRIIATPKQGGWDVVDPFTGQLIYHQKGPKQAGAGAGGLTAAGTGVANSRVNTVATNAVKHQAAKGFDLAKAGSPSSKVQVGTQQSATPFVTAMAKALSVAPQTRKGITAAIAIMTGSYQPVIDEMTSFLGDSRVAGFVAQADDAAKVLAGQANPSAEDKQKVVALRNSLAATVYQWGLQQGFPNDLLQYMVGSAFHTDAFKTEGSFFDKRVTMPSFANPGDAASWYINHVLQGLPTAQTTAATSGGGAPFRYV